MSLINVNNLTFHYEGNSDNIFENVSFQIDTNWKLGFIGRNGRGKTTFLKLLMEEYEYTGNISSNESFDYFPFPIRDRDETFLENIETIYPSYELWKICRELSYLDVEEDILYRPFYTLSNGEQTKAMLAVLFSQENKFLLIDEPTNHLDIKGKESIREYLKQKKGFILVSHDRDILDQCVDHILVINKTNIEVYKGNFSTWQEEKKRQDERELQENERLKKDIKRLEQSARIKEEWADDIESRKIGKKAAEEAKKKGVKASARRAYMGEKSRKMQRRRKNLEHREEKAIEEKSGLLKNLETIDDLKLFPLRHYKETLVSLSDFCIYYEKQDGDCKRLGTVSFDLKNGECLVLHGKNGCGKSSILKAVIQAAEEKADKEKAGKKEDQSMSLTDKIHYTGTVTTASGLTISYVPQDTSHLKGSLADYAENYGLNLTNFLMLLRKLDLGREQFEKNMEDYSGGQKKKVLIARSLCEQAHLYIWDEALNYIDIFSRIQIEELLMKYRPTMLLVEHDAAFVEKVGTKIVEIKGIEQ